MAERLPRYRPLGVAIPSVPGVDFTRAARAEGRMFETIGDALSKMSDFAFERQKSETIRQAERYAFDNPITPEQLEEAKNRGIDLDDVVGDPDTVFGSTVRATTGKVMSAQLEALYRQEIAIMQRNMESPIYDPEDPQVGVAAQTRRLAALEQGYTDAIADVDAKAAVSFKAGVAALGGSAYKTALEIRNKKLSAGLMLVAQQSMDDLSANARGIIMDDAGNGELDGKLQNLRISVETTLVQTGNNDFIKSNAKAIDGIFTKAKIDVLSNHAISEEFAMSPLGASERMSRGDFGRYTGVYNSLSAEEQAEVRKNVQAEFAAQDKIQEADRKENNRIATSNVVRIVQGLSGEITEAQRTAGIANLYSIAVRTSEDAISFSAIKKLEKELEESVPSNYKGNLKLRIAIAEGQVTLDNFPEAMELYGVTAKDAFGMVANTATRNKQDQAEALRLARSTAGVIGDLSPVTDKQATQIHKFMTSVETKYMAALSDWEDAGSVIGDRPTMLGVAEGIQSNIIASEIDTQIQNEINSANDALQDITGFKFTITTTREEIDDIIFNNKLSKADKDAQRLTLKSQIRKIEDLQRAKERLF